MSITKLIAKHFREVYFGGNWTFSNLKENLADVNWQQATTQVFSLNTIATLVFHIHYYVGAVLMVLRGESLTASDKYAFTHPPIQSQSDWDHFLEHIWVEAELFLNQVDQMSDEMLWEIFSEEKYGTYYRNLTGIIEHTHYHLGQIAIIKKIIAQKESDSL